MGAQQFENIGKGKTVEEAFFAAVKQALWDNGHSGYTGTLAEKYEFVKIEVPAGTAPQTFVTQLLNSNDERISDKWGPAGAVKLGADTWIFFGWASS